MKLTLLIAAIVLTFTSPTFAHDAKPRHGGRVVEASERHVEMVAKDSTLDVYLRDHDDKPLKLTGYKGVAILSIEGKSQRIVLEPAGDSQLSGKAAAALPAQPKGVVQLTPPGGRVINAKFD